MHHPSIRLPHSTMPLLGLGTYLISNEAVSSITYQALSLGYRHIDTAEGYANEQGIGKAIKQAIAEQMISREALFITTKLWPGHAAWGQKTKSFADTLAALEQSLQHLGLAYIDLYLIHAPFAHERRLEQWQALMHLQGEGKVKEIGVSNFSIQHLEEIKQHGLAMPAVNQIELHPWTQQRELLEYMRANAITPIAYSSLVPLSTWRDSGKQASAKTALMQQESDADHSALKQIAKRHKVSEAQILLRWSVQQGIPVIPKSVNSDRLKQNADLFSFQLSSDEMQILAQQHKGAGVAWAKGDPLAFDQ